MIRALMITALAAAAVAALTGLVGLDLQVAHLLVRHPLWLGGLGGVLAGIVIVLYVVILG